MGNCQNLPEGLGKKFAHKSKGPSSLIVSTFTWARDSHGLFDYESKTLSKKVFKAQAAGTIRRNINDVIFTRENEKLMKQSDGDLVKLGVREGCFWIDPAGEETVKGDKENNAAVDISSLEQDPWLVVKSYKANTNKGYKLTEGEIIKLGRVKYRIREIRGSPGGSQTKSSPPEKQVINTDADNNASLDESFKRSPRSSKEIQPVTSQTCRICLSESCEADNPFFSPCNCSGTMKLIHVKCLQTWLKSKIRVKHSENTTFTYWKTLECELCKTSYPQYFDVENKRYDIVEIERPNSAYIIMEILSKEKNTTKGIHLVKMEGKNNIRMGRGHDSDIRITDISVSRCHAIIKLEKGNYYIEDNNSKFGTLVHLDKPTPIIGEFNDISLQIGRTVVTLTTKKGKGILPNCFGSPSNLNTSMNERDSDQPNSVFADINLNEIASPTILNGLGSPLSPNRAPIVVIGPRERAYRVNAISNPEESLGVILNARQNRLHNNILQQNMGEHENEGNVGEEAEERSFQ